MKVSTLAPYLLASILFLIAQGSSTSANTNGDLSSPGYCTVCADGSTPVNLEAQLDLNYTSRYMYFPLFDSSKLTCGNVDSILKNYKALASDHTCNGIQFAGIERCGCPDLRINPCNLCQDEQDEFNPDTLVPQLRDTSMWGGPSYHISDKYITCFQYAVELSKFKGDNEICSAFQATLGERCGCSKVRDVQCPFCDSGNAIPDPLRIVGTYTCDAYALYNTYQRERTRGCNFFTRIVPYERCCADEAMPTSSPTEEPLCSVTCGDGSSPSLDHADVDLGLNLVLNNYHLYDDTGTIVSLMNVTCGNIQDFIEKNSISFSNPECPRIAYEVAINCKCPRQDDRCYLCEDKKSTYNAQKILPWEDYDRSCSDIAFGIFTSSPYYPPNECSIQQATRGEYCGCSNPIARASLECTLCGDKLIPDPGRMFAGTSCADWEFSAVSFCPNDNKSTMAAAEYCCAKEAAPTAAPTDKTPTDKTPTDKTPTDKTLFSLCNATPCVDGSIPSLSFADIELGLNLPLVDINGVYDTVSDLKCGNVQEFMKSYKPNLIEHFFGRTCEMIEFAGILKCGCPDLRVNPCDLCEDDTSRFDPTKESPLGPDSSTGLESTCFDLAASTWTDSLFCSFKQATVGEYCGCSNPVARAAYGCPFCGPGTRLPDPSREYQGKRCAVWERERYNLYFSEPDCGFMNDPNFIFSGYFKERADYCCTEDIVSLCPATPCEDGSIPSLAFNNVNLGIRLVGDSSLKCNRNSVQGFIEKNGIRNGSPECGTIRRAGIDKCGCLSTQISSSAPTPAPTAKPTMKPTTKSPTLRPTTPTMVSLAPTPTPPFKICFSGETTVHVNDSRGTLLMKDLRLGDQVLVDEAGKYEAVYSFGHRDESSEASFLRLLPSSVEISMDHMVKIAGGQYVPASTIKVGDMLETTSADGAPISITGIETVVRKGVYAPFTMSGTIVVSNIKASNYVSFQDSDMLVIGGWTSPLSYQWLAHLSQGPHRIWVLVFGISQEEMYTDIGMSTWIDGPHRLGERFVVQHPLVMTVVLIPVVTCLVVVSAIETVLTWMM